jgi:hypothetical protein
MQITRRLDLIENQTGIRIGISVQRLRWMMA